MVNSVSLSSDGTTLASGSFDGTVLLWDMQVLLPHPQTLTKHSGDDEQGPAGAVLARSFVVSVLDQYGKPFAGAEVTFSIAAGEGTLSATSASTGSNGRAATTLTLGNKPGRNTVVARVADLKAVISALPGRESPRG